MMPHMKPSPRTAKTQTKNCFCLALDVIFTIIFGVIIIILKSYIAHVLYNKVFKALSYIQAFRKRGY